MKFVITRGFILLLITITFSINCSNAQIITTFAGNGFIGNTGDGELATVAKIGSPNGCIFDSYGNFYFADASNNVIRKIDIAGIISTIAGTGSAGYNGDEIPATMAQLNDPLGIAIDSVSNIYIADNFNRRIRKIDNITGMLTTIAGNGSIGYSGDGGPSTNAVFRSVENICLNKFGNIYILDYSDSRIRKINKYGIISTIAGTGIAGDSGDGNPATTANIENMVGICTDNIGNVYFSEQALKVRMVNAVTGIITTVAGIDSEGANASGDGGPATAAGLDPYNLAFDRMGNLYVSGYLYNNVRKINQSSGIIHTVAGTGIGGYNGDNIPATNAQLNSPIGIALDTCDNLFITEIRNHRIRKVSFNPYPCPYLATNTLYDKAKIVVYPNPTYDILNIDNLKTQSTYQLFNIIGSSMQQGILQIGNNNISLQSLPSGMYMLELTDDEGKRTVHKIIKQ